MKNKKRYWIMGILFLVFLWVFIGEYSQRISSNKEYETESQSYKTQPQTKETDKKIETETNQINIPTNNNSNSYESYDSGYNDVLEDDYYDTGRYEVDDEYAEGVDDAIEDYEDEYGEDFE